MVIVVCDELCSFVRQKAFKNETSNPKYVTDNTGKKLSVVLPFKEYEWLMEEVEGKHSSSSPKSKGKASGLRGKLSPMTNEQIDQQFKSMRNEC